MTASRATGVIGLVCVRFDDTGIKARASRHLRELEMASRAAPPAMAHSRREAAAFPVNEMRPHAGLLWNV